MSRKHFEIFCIGIAVVAALIKIYLALDIPYSCMFADDYDYLNKSHFFLDGNWTLQGYPFTRRSTGIAYPLLISPWLFSGDIAGRHLIVFGINFVLASVAIYFSSKTISSISGVRSLLIPLCMASFGIIFQYGFYVMTENLLFPILAVLSWLVVDFDATCRSKTRLTCLVVFGVLAPLCRSPGFAILPAVLFLFWRHRSVLGRRKTIVWATVYTAAVSIPYSLMQGILLQSSRPLSYAKSLSHIILPGDIYPVWGNAITLANLGLNQMAYVFVSCGYWVLPLLLVFSDQLLNRKTIQNRSNWLNLIGFCTISALMFVAFGMVHLVSKFQLNPEHATFIYGRYNDPAVFLCVVAGLAAVFSLERPNRAAICLFRYVVPVALFFVLLRLRGSHWAPINQTGLSLFYPLEGLPVWAIPVTFVLVLVLADLLASKKFRVPVFLGCFVVFNILSIAQGWKLIHRNAHCIDRALRVADWINAELPQNVRIACDYSVAKRKAPFAFKSVYNVYRTLSFCVYPRQVGMPRQTNWSQDDIDLLAEYDYFFGLESDGKPWHGFQEVWRHGDYRLYKIDPESIHPDPLHP